MPAAVPSAQTHGIVISGCMIPSLRGSRAEQRPASVVTLTLASHVSGAQRGLLLPACDRTQVYLSSVMTKNGRSRIDPTSAEKVGMRGRFRESERVETPPHRAEFWFSLGACGPLPASGARKAAPSAGVLKRSNNLTTSNRSVGDARADLELFAGGLPEGLIGRQHDRDRAHPLMGRLHAPRRRGSLDQGLGGLHETVARHDDPVIGGDQILLASIDDRSHELLDRGVLHGETGDAAIGNAGLLGGAVDQIIVVLVGAGPEGARLVDHVASRPVAHGGDFFLAQRAHGMVVPVPYPAVLVVDRNPEMPAGRMVAARRDHGDARHDPLPDAAIVASRPGPPAPPDPQTAP